MGEYTGCGKSLSKLDEKKFEHIWNWYTAQLNEFNEKYQENSEYEGESTSELESELEEEINEIREIKE